MVLIIVRRISYSADHSHSADAMTATVHEQMTVQRNQL
jgi:hypothetical protein